jgi:hypothetical protein
MAYISVYSFSFISVQRWQKIALLVFQRLPVCRQKPNVLFVRWLFFGMAYNEEIYTTLHMYLTCLQAICQHQQLRFSPQI